MQHEQMHEGRMSNAAVGRTYTTLAMAAAGMLILMYLVMFTMIYSLGEFIQNMNFFYMAIMMATPMVVMMPLMMPAMYPNRKLNLLIYFASAALFLLAFVGIRAQLLVGDRQFLRSMIPHHSGAILMCERARLTDPQIKALCSDIISSQKLEIAQMKEILARK